MDTIFKREIHRLGVSYRQMAMAMGVPSGEHRHICLVANGRRDPSRKWRLKFISAINKITSGEISFTKNKRRRAR